MQFEKVDGIIDVDLVLVDENTETSIQLQGLIDDGLFDVSKVGSKCIVIDVNKTLYIAIGDSKDFNSKTGNIDKVARAIVSTYNEDLTKLSISADTDVLTNRQNACDFATALTIAEYRYVLEGSENEVPEYTLGFYGDVDSILEPLYHGSLIGEGVNFTRRLGDMPANLCTPTHLSSIAQFELGAMKNVSVSVIGEDEAKKLGMRLLTSVSDGSDEEGKVIIINYQGGEAEEKDLGLVGKAVTFDSGGISIKPSAKMEEMKYDMCGGATVMGVIYAAAALELPVNIVGLVGAVENMPNGRATKPSSVVESMSGITVEITNTDAEGRLVLADLLTYIGDIHECDTVIDLATLTGACCVALGDHAAGVFTHDDDLAAQLINAGEVVNDRAWRLPMWEDYNKELKTMFADVNNCAKGGAGASTAACFLGRFAEKHDYTHAHMDIAGVAWKKMATGRPVKLLLEYIITNR